MRRPKVKRPGRARTAQLPSERWQEAYRKAMRQYGVKSQAERIAWGAIDEVIARRRLKKKTA